MDAAYGERGPEKTDALAPRLCRAGLWPPRAPGVALEADKALAAAPEAPSCGRGAYTPGGRLALQGGGAQRALLVIEAPLHSQRGLQPMARACPWGTLPGLGLDRQAGADRFKRVGGEG